MDQIVVVDTGAEKEPYVSNSCVWQETAEGSGRFVFIGSPFLEYERHDDGTLKTDSYGQPRVATYLAGDGEVRPKHGPVLMQWEPSAFLVQSGDYVGYRGAWIASGGAMRPHSHVSVNEGYVVTNGIY